MNKKEIFKSERAFIFLLIIIILSLIFVLYLGNEKNSPVSKIDLFKGNITNLKTVPGNVSGVGVYDKTCKSIGDGLTMCNAGIKTEKYGVLNFNYVHNMAIEPCIVSGDKLQIEILDSKGTARVKRIG